MFFPSQNFTFAILRPIQAFDKFIGDELIDMRRRTMHLGVGVTGPKIGGTISKIRNGIQWDWAIKWDAISD
jgi:hypothetical protein